MSQKLGGNLVGLAPSQKKRIERLFNRRIASDELVSLDLARELYQIGRDLKRRIGILMTREGRIVEVFVGTKNILYLPDLGRYRLGTGRLRRLRLIFSDLNESHEDADLPEDIYTDLEKLRLDGVVSIKEARNRVIARWAHIVPMQASTSRAVETHVIPDLGRFEFDFRDFIEGLEAELLRQDSLDRRGQEGGALLVGVYSKRHLDPEGSMAELVELSRTAGVRVREILIQRRELDPRTLLGKGKLEEVVLTCLRLGAELIIFDTELKPSQWRSITNSTELKVIDRSMLILDIFAQRASSSDGRLQVELAQLRYNLPRLVEKDAGLSRLSGGIGGRGPGETKLEIGRRRIRDRISELEKKIDQLSGQRGLRRRKRIEEEIPLACIVGYTNVGKSTLFNAMTGSNVLAENKLFATLDPAERRLVIPDAKGNLTTLIVSDTVGFIRELPDELAAAFRATLEVLNDASLLIHVLDASDPRILERRQAVHDILNEMNLTDVPILTFLNKSDLIEPTEREKLEREFNGISISAFNKEDVNRAKSKILSILNGK